MLARALFLARLSGLFMIITALALLVGRYTIVPAMNALMHDHAALLVVAMVGLCAGLAMVLCHNIWSGGLLPVLVTLIGWSLLLRSALLLFLSPNSTIALYEAVRVEALYPLYAVISLLIGGYLTYAGFQR